MTVTGTTLNPSASSASCAASFSSMFNALNGCRARERNSFTCAQDRQCEPVYTVMSRAIHELYDD